MGSCILPPASGAIAIVSCDLEIEHRILYVTLGRRRPAGWVMAHNSVRQSIALRWFWVDDTEHWEVCDWGGRTDKGAHYRFRSAPPRHGQARTLRAIIKRICAGTLARWALNYENSLALPDWQKYDSHLAPSNARGWRWREWQRWWRGWQ
jgi:hypothetical protein